MANRDVTDDASNPDMTAIAATDRWLVIDAGTNALQEAATSVLSA